MARWLIRELCDRDFDIAAMDGLERGQFEGHAFSFIHRRYLRGIDLPVVPVIVNTFDPPNQPTPRRCIQLGATLRELIAGYPEDLRVGVLASGGLSHFVVDEALDEGIIDAIRRKDTAYGRARPQATAGGQFGDPQLADCGRGSQDTDLEWVSYTPTASPLTGTGLCCRGARSIERRPRQSSKEHGEHGEHIMTQYDSRAAAAPAAAVRFPMRSTNCAFPVW